MINSIRISLHNLLVRLAMWIHPSKQTAQEMILDLRRERLIFGESFYTIVKIDPYKVFIKASINNDKVPTTAEIADIFSGAGTRHIYERVEQ